MVQFEWSWAFFFKYLPVILEAAKVTLLATVVSFAVAMVLGLLVAVGRDSERVIVRRSVAFGAEFIRRTPLLVQIYFIYYILPKAGVVLPALVCGIMALSLHYSTYLAEVYRAGLRSVGRGQRDAAAALGLRPVAAFRLVVFPQALVPVVPALGNYLIILFKETPLLSAIAVVEMLQRAKIIGSLTFRYTEPITTVAIVFLVLSLLSAAGVRRLERSLKRHLEMPHG